VEPDRNWSRRPTASSPFVITHKIDDFPIRQMRLRPFLMLPFLVLLLPRQAWSEPSPAPPEPFDPRTLVFIGSSSIAFWKSLPEDFPGHRVLNLGRAGTTYSHLVAHVGEWAVLYPAERYILYSGDNDVAWLRSPAKVARQFREVAEALRAAIPGVRVYVISIKPNRSLGRRLRAGAARKANALLEAEAAALGYATYVDIHTPMLAEDGGPRGELFSIDGIHMNRKGYEVWSGVLRPLLETEAELPAGSDSANQPPR
jgi:lysophospholipase L1-like esterase